jgi:hypothetical protein
MKIFSVFIILHFLFACNPAYSQRIPSSCSATDSVRSLFLEDAEKLAVSKFYRRKYAEKDSALIPVLHIDTILNALIALRNVPALKPRDTVMNNLRIRVIEPPLSGIGICADSTLPWMMALRLGKKITGDPVIDSVLSKYKFALSDYFDFGDVFNYHCADLITPDHYNLGPIIKSIEKIPGVYYVLAGGYIGEYDDMSDSIYNDHIQFTYKHGWGDCPAGCIYHRYWKFNVYFNCDVEFAGSYGNFIPNGVPETKTLTFSIHPNPFTDHLIIEGPEMQYEYSIADHLGRQILKGDGYGQKTINFAGILPGVYILNISSGSQSKTLKIVH